MDLDVFWRILDEGSTPAIALIAYLIWKLDKRIGEFIAALEAVQEIRDTKLDTIHNDIDSMIRKLAGMNGSQS